MLFFFFKSLPRTCLRTLERGGGRERGRERNVRVREKHQSVASHPCSDWDTTHNLGVCPDPELSPPRSNQLSHTAWG